MSHDPLPDWNQWQALSRQYLDTWQSMAGGDAARMAAGDKPSMKQGFEQWSRLFGPHAGAGAETLERIVESVKGYAAFMQAMLGSISTGAAPMGLPPSVSAQFAMPGFDAGSLGHPAFRGWSDYAGTPASGFLQALAAMAASRPSAGAHADATTELKSWLNLPTFGLMREHQQHYQEAASVWLDYQQQMSRYNALMLKASQRGFESFQSKLASREEPGRQVDSLRGLYDLWVDAAEEGYAEVALSIEFREAYAALVNAQMRVRASVQQEVERISSDLGLPTRSEINSIGERLQALRREVRSGRRQAGHRVSERLRRQAETPSKTLARVNDRAEASDDGGETDALSDAVAPVEAGADERGSAARKRKRSARRGEKAATSGAVRTKKEKKTVRAKRGSDERAVAATAPGTFASRIARFADASLGASRPRASKAAKPKKSKKNR